MEGDFCFSIVETLPLCFPWGHVHNVTPPNEHQRRALKNRPWWENGLQTKQQHEEMTRPAVTTDPSGKLRVLTEDGDWVLIHPATSTSFPSFLSMPLPSSFRLPSVFFPLSYLLGQPEQRLFNSFLPRQPEIPLQEPIPVLQ